MRNRPLSRVNSLTTTTNSLNRYPNHSYHSNHHSNLAHSNSNPIPSNQPPVNQHHLQHRPMYRNLSSTASDTLQARRMYSTTSTSSPIATHSDTRGSSLISPTITPPSTSPSTSPKSSQVRYPNHFRHGSVIRLASGTLKVFYFNSISPY